MKSRLTTAILCALPLCSAASADSIDTFNALCMANAGNPKAAITAGKRAGFKMQSLGRNSAMGMRKSTDEGLQINSFTKHKFECAVTTSDAANPKAVSKKFFASLGLKPRNNKAKGKINGKTYTFLHDTKGGEAFVIFAK